jgi:ketosteroid isomerase-like protein
MRNRPAAAFATAALLLFSARRGEDAAMTASHVLEIRSYNLKPGTRERFHALAEREAIPMLRRWKIDVVAYGPSRHDADTYYLMRAFPSVGERQRMEDAFYGSDEWRQGPREAVLAAIESYTTVVIEVDDATLQGLRAAGHAEASSGSGGTGESPRAHDDLTTLLELNRDYVRSVQGSDVARFRQILADDFLCSLPDGTLIDREMFLERTALPPQIRDLDFHDVNVRLLGDFAIVHAQTTFTTAEGRPGVGRYTDVWARRDGRWLAIAAHVTRR